MLAPLIDSAGDNEDDFIRLFYVSITRAKHSLFISGHDSIIRYVPEELINKNKENQEVDISAYENCLSIVRGPYSQDEQIALKKLVENYHLSVTNMQNFLDVTKGGPAFFIEQNILRFPSAMPASAAFGSAVHKALEKMIIYPKQNASEAPNLDFVINVFNKSLLQARLEQKDYRKNYDKGVKILTAYYNKRYSFFRVDDAVETEDDGYYIIDFKTGKTSHEWDDSKSEDYEKRKLHNYRQQLIFYQILIENSARFKKPIKTLSLEFVESIVEEDSPVTLIYNPSVEEIERLKKLAQVVYGCIVNLDFPDVSHYEQDFSGRLQFEEDLIARVN